ncbi:MAG TPA: Gfo/Idh/MocA family oxidoreductase [Acidimicrobiales bacterium]|nr:Gfo/Idh/MocA family oxidoreductase [Acidimicrobiales bacterium]
MGITIGLVGAGQFAPQFAPLFKRHPDVDGVVVTDVLPERANALAESEQLDGTVESFDALLRSSCDAVAIFTQRWTHGPLVLEALRAGKHVYSTVPMAFTTEEIVEIVDQVASTGLTYMMGETSYYNPAAVYARQRLAAGDFGKVFYAEGDYVHDMDIGFYDAYKYSGGENWKATASFPPMQYPTHATGGVLSVLPAHVISVSCLGVHDDLGDGVFDKDVSMFGNDFSNATALFELSDGGIMRTNEMRRVGYPSMIRESRFRFFGTKGSFEQLATVSVWQDKEKVTDVSELLATSAAETGANRAGHARIHDTSRLPASYEGLPNGHEGAHHFLADDFVRSVVTGGLPPVNAWAAARYTLPGIVAHQSAQQGGARLPVLDLGGPPEQAQ